MEYTWVVVKIIVPFGSPKYEVQYNYIKDLQTDHNFDDHPYGFSI